MNIATNGNQTAAGRRYGRSTQPTGMTIKLLMMGRMALLTCLCVLNANAHAASSVDTSPHKVVIARIAEHPISRINELLLWNINALLARETNIAA